MRKNIFQILEEQFDLHREIERIDYLFRSELIIFETRSVYCVEKFVDTVSFHNWKQRNRCINTRDLRKSLGIDNIIKHLNPTMDMVVTYLEYVENMLNLAENVVQKNFEFGYESTYNILQGNLDDLLDRINYEKHVFDDEEMVLIAEKNAEATAVAEIVDTKTSLKVIRYNHYLLKGDIQAKKDIILELAYKLEPERKQLDKLDNKLSSNLFYMLNNLNLRHNNIDKASKSYKATIAEMREDILEYWYDETYQLELLAFLLLDNVKRNKKVDELKAKVEGQNNA